MNSWNLDMGTLVAGRFEIEHLVRTGGAETVFRARDRRNGLRVALKVFRPVETRAQEERFTREATALAKLRHPGVATYVAHGQTQRREPFLATEWLDGESLAERLSRRPLNVAESLILARRVGETLAAIHSRGLCHRAITPGKVLLRAGRVELATLLDFGVTRGNLATRTVTSSAEILSALRYLAPEQARGEAQLGPGVDIYALGCVLFHCLTGTPPFAEGSVTGVLAQILYKEVPRLGQLRPELPEALETLLSRMLAKQPAERLPDGVALMAQLTSLEVSPEQLVLALGPSAGAPRVEAQRRLVCLVLIRPPRIAAHAAAGPESSAGTLEEPDMVSRFSEFERLLQPYSAQIEIRDDGAVLASLAHPEQAMAGWTATDQAMKAARAAQVLQMHLPDWPVALVTERSLSGVQYPAAAIERAKRLLDLGAELGTGSSTTLWLDELTAGLLDTRFLVRTADASAGVFVLERERVGLDEVRPLLGRATPYVGRTQELQLLELVFRSGVADDESRTVVVLGASGMGKSRLRHELVRRLTERNEPLEVLLGHGDPLRAGTPGGLLADALLSLCAARDIEDPEERRARFAERIGKHLDEAARQTVAGFLGELCGLSFADEQSAQLRAARQDPRLMSDHMTAALVSFLRAECAAHPVLFILEDLHWSDAATVRLIDAALHELADRPLLVLALGRPEVKEQFPQLWERHNVHELQLGGLGREASERLVREVLGSRATPELCTRIAAQAGGNALFLEELIRAVAEGTDDEPSETFLTMLQARFLRLEPGARRLLGAASVLGEVFWRGGLLDLLWDGPRALREREREVDRWLGILVAAEIVVRHGASHCRYPGEVELAFRHSLLREAAYGLLTEEDRRVGHRLAAAYLERMGERDAMVLAEHYDRGGEGERAAHFLARAAAAAIDASDFDGALRCVARAVACGAAGEVLGMLRAVEASAHLWQWNFKGAYIAGQGGMPLLSRGSVEWYRAVGTVITTGSAFGMHDQMLVLVRELLETTPRPGAESAAVEPAVMAYVPIASLGLRELATPLLRSVEEVCTKLGDCEARSQGLLRVARGFGTIILENNPWRSLEATREGLGFFASAGDQRYHCVALGLGGLAESMLGNHEAALQKIQDALVTIVKLQEMALEGAIQAYLAFALAETRKPEDLAQAVDIAKVVAARFGMWFWGALAHAALVRTLLARGEVVEAEEVARQAVGVMEPVPLSSLLARTLWSMTLLARGRPEEACVQADVGLALLRSFGGQCLYDITLLLAAAEAHHAMGDLGTARTHLAAARRLIDERAAQMTDPAARERYLHRVVDHARVLELEQLW
jgi:tetratricopeptide (TPR) repeat protein